MKKIEAYIKKIRIGEVIESLHKIKGLTGVTSFNIHGFGRIHSENECDCRVTDDPTDGEPYVKFEIMCKDDLLESVIDAIIDGAHTGLCGDGKIYVSEISEAIRISTKQRGEDFC